MNNSSGGLNVNHLTHYWKSYINNYYTTGVIVGHSLAEIQEEKHLKLNEYLNYYCKASAVKKKLVLKSH